MADSPLFKTHKTTLVLEATEGRKIRVSSNSLRDGVLILLPGQRLKIMSGAQGVEARLAVGEMPPSEAESLGAAGYFGRRVLRLVERPDTGVEGAACAVLAEQELLANHGEAVILDKGGIYKLIHVLQDAGFTILPPSKPIEGGGE